MLRLLTIALCAASVASLSLLTASSRRDVIARAMAAPLVALVPASAHAASVFTGEYDDPKHPGCLRSIKVDGGRSRTAYVSGVDGLPEKTTKKCPAELKATPADLWKLEGTVAADGKTISIDFSPKTNGRVGLLEGKYEDGGIVFPDGNKWTKVVKGTPERRPPASP